jgi:hypothetical protein
MTTTLISAIVGLIGLLIGYYFNEQRHKREIGVKMIEIAVSVLSQKPDENRPLRGWATNVLEKYAKEAGAPSPPQDFQNYRLPITTIFDAATGRSTMMRMPDTMMGMPETLREEARKAADDKGS